MPPKPLDAEERERLYLDFAYVYSRTEIDQKIEEAHNHKAINNVTKSVYLYCRNWIRNSAERNRPNVKPPQDRDVAKYYEWPNRRGQ